MGLADRLLSQPFVYRAWQAPFAERKFAPFNHHNDLASVGRVLDVGCGPGTNTAHFSASPYLGIDVNPGYIADARRRYARDFLVADVTTYSVDASEGFDCIIVNSLLHHINTDDTRRLLSHLATLLTETGHVHIFDLVLPASRSIGRLLARWDRGEYPRPLGDWRALFGEHFEPAVVEPYALDVAGMTLWNMVYFKGRRRDPDRPLSHR